MPDGLKLQQHFKLTTPLFSREDELGNYFASSQSSNVKRFWQQQLTRKQSASLVIGDSGLGKICSWNQYQKQMNHELFDTVFFSSRQNNTRQLFLHICSHLSINTSTRKQDFRSSIEKHLKEQEKTLVLVFAQAQTYSMIMYAYLFKWLQLAKYKNYGLQLFFIADKSPAFEKKNKALQRWIGETFEYEVLTYQETLSYLISAEKNAGNGELFHPEARAELARKSGGNIARLNSLAQNALQLAFEKKSSQVLLSHFKPETESIEKRNNAVIADSGYFKKRWLKVALLVMAVFLVIPVVYYLHIASSTTISPNNIQKPQLAELPPNNKQDVEKNIIREALLDDVLPAIVVNQKQSRQMAFSALSRRWGFASTIGIEKEALCQLLILKTYQCLDFKADLHDILQLNLPVVMGITVGENIRYAALLAVEQQQALLSMEGELLHLPVNVLERYDSGSFTVFWPSKYLLITDELKPGDMDKNIIKIRSLLIQWAEQNRQYKVPDMIYNLQDSIIYTQDDVELLSAFQRHKNLPVTSIIQPYMLVLLQQMIRPVGILLHQPSVFKD